MKYIICYDIKEDRVRARVVKYLEARALRVQYSVFTCRASAVQMEEMRTELLRLLRTANAPLLLSVVPVSRLCGCTASRSRRMWIDAFVASFAQKLRKGVHEDSYPSLSPS